MSAVLRGIPKVVMVLLAGLIFTTSAYAQTIPAGGAASVPYLPTSPVPPPSTTVPPALSDIPTRNVTFQYFGASSVVTQYLVPRLVTTSLPVAAYSGPDATPEERAGATFFGLKPAGSQFIVFFARGSRSYVYDVLYGNYCWIDNAVLN